MERSNIGRDDMRSYSYFDLIMAAFVGVLAISNVAYTKILLLGSFTFNRGMALFPLAYIFGDILTGVYGYQKSWRINWTSLFWAFTAAAAFSAVGALPSAPGYALGADFHAILGQTPWIIAGDPLAYFTGEFTSSYVPTKIKIWTSGRRLWTRTIGSTPVGEGLGTVVFLTVALLRSLPGRLPAAVFISSYAFKAGVETLSALVTYAIVSLLERSEQEDCHDRNTNFSPLLVRG